jgi:curved DNA-binding protein CbpA
VVVIYLALLNFSFRVLSEDEELTIYKEFGVSKYSSSSEIMSQYKKLAVKYHPDRNPEQPDKFMRIENIYEVIKDKQAKYLYDKFGTLEVKSGSDVVYDIMMGIISSYIPLVQILFYLLINIFDSFQFKFVLSIFFVFTILISYLLFLKTNENILDYLFPELMTFQIIKACTNHLIYQIIFLTKFVIFIFENKIQRFNKMIKEIFEFAKVFSDFVENKQTDTQDGKQVQPENKTETNTENKTKPKKNKKSKKSK